ncbi:hypothetical protein BDR04DRAFT_1099874 [Suillus decipiens]|nr:hypothetical protein BDR04DRAFT_1099874 [Suillus decipiens]
MRFSFLTAIVALTTSIISVTAKQPDCTPLGGSCNQHSDCCDLVPYEADLGSACLPPSDTFSSGNVCAIIELDFDLGDCLEVAC